MISIIDGILEAARQNRRGIIAVAAAHDDAVIEAVVAARKAELITPILVGHIAETVNPKAPATLDADALCKTDARWAVFWPSKCERNNIFRRKQ